MVREMICEFIRRFGKTSVSEQSVRNATYKVRRELREMGLMASGSLLDQIPVKWEPKWSFDNLWSVAHGWLGFFSSDGCMHIPENYIAGLFGWESRNLTATLRHEYGHALESCYPEYFHDEHFINAFGDDYGENSVQWSPEDCVSTYARTNTQEDFAETFMLYLKHKGVLPEEFSKRKAIRAKWRAIKAICQKVLKDER